MHLRACVSFPSVVVDRVSGNPGSALLVATRAGVSVFGIPIAAAADHEDAGAEHEQPKDEADPSTHGETLVHFSWGSGPACMASHCARELAPESGIWNFLSHDYDGGALAIHQGLLVHTVPFFI